MSKCLKFCTGLKFKADFHSKMSVCRHELGVEPPPPAIKTLLPGEEKELANFYAACGVVEHIQTDALREKIVASEYRACMQCVAQGKNKKNSATSETEWMPTNQRVVECSSV